MAAGPSPSTNPPAPVASAPSVPSAPTPPPTSAPAPVPARAGTIRESGAVRRDSVRAERWLADGMAKVLGDVDVDALEFTGRLSIGGRLSAGTFRVDGAVEVLGAVVVRDLVEVKGSARFESGIEAGALTVLGPLRAPGPVRVGGVGRIDGEATLGKGADFGTLIGRGGLQVPGPLAAQRVAYEITRDSAVESITSPTVGITRPSAPPFRIPGLTPDRPTLKVLRMEAEEVRLEGVTVEVLKADRIVLGPDCHVARLFGTVAEADPTSHVGPESRSPPPHGIWR